MSDPFRFNFEKTLQAIAVLLRQSENRTDNYMRLLKLLYLADRKSLAQMGRPITGDRVVAMKRGPVLSRTLDMINDKHARSADLFRHIQKVNYEIQLVHDPGNAALSRAEIDILHGVSRDFASMDEWELVEKTHELPEWRKNDPGDSSRRIPLPDILEAIGQNDRLKEILEAAEEERSIARLFELPVKSEAEKTS
ncbi:MAG: SocA family protein [Phycisphaerae bacterium]|nr:SocA family protein [Phycisphaerae bacterium]